MTGAPRSAAEAFVSVVVPVYNEQEVLPTLRERLVAVLEEAAGRFEVILVDDGSSDATPELLRRFHEEDPRFKAIHFSRNFGHQPAVTAGLASASGDVACVMDADLQDPPEVLPRLLAEWEKGSDVVYAVRRERKEGAAVVALYALFYRLLDWLSTIRMPLDAGDFCLVSRRVLDEMNRLPEKERYVRGLRAWAGFRQTGVSYERAAREHGRSKYDLAGLARLALNGIVSFSDRPLIMVAVAGAVVSGLAFAYGLYLVALRFFFGGIVTGYASLMGAILFLSGVQLLAIGVLGLYLSKIFQEVKARPTYVVRATRGIGGPDELADGGDAAR